MKDRKLSRINLSEKNIEASLPKHPTKLPQIQTQIDRIVVHTTDGVVTPQGLAKYDIGPNHISSTGCPTITYHKMVTQAGLVFKTCDDRIVTWHAGNWNQNSLAIALVYKTHKDWEQTQEKGILLDPDPRRDENIPSVEMVKALIQVLASECLKHSVTPNKIFGHRELKGTGWTLQKGSKKLRKTCPGFAIEMNFIRRSVAELMQLELKDAGLYTGKIDGIFGPASSAALFRWHTDE